MIKHITGLTLTFILIAIGYSNRGSFSVEFSTKEACEVVKDELLDKVGSGFSGAVRFIKCYPKGDIK